MRYILFILIIVFSLTSCLRNKELVTLSVTNSILYYFDGNQPITTGDFPIQYNTIADLIKARNTIEFELTNNTDKDILFLMNPYELNISSNFLKNRQHSSSGLFFTINDTENYSIKIHSGSYNLENWDYIELLEYKQKDYYLKKEIQIDSVFREREILSNSFILKSNETKTFTIQLDLPIIKQPFIENYLDFLVVMMVDEEYFFQIYYNMSQDEIVKVLRKEELEYFKNNNIEIFSGQLLSNKVKVVPLK